MAQTIHLVYCRCACHHALPDAVGAEVFAGLSGRGVKFHAIDDLCELAARRDNRLMELADGLPVRIAACYPRAVRSMLAWAGLAIADLKIFNMRQMTAEQVLAGMTEGQSDCGFRIACHGVANGRSRASRELNGHDKSNSTGETCLRPMPQTTATTKEEDTTRGWDASDTNQKWQPWFPVIDPDRCIQCGKCLNFCLFGVYAKVDGKVCVTNPDKCKNNCPACARICPTAAIIFPKYPDAPINGDEVRPEDIARQKMQSDPSAMSKGDVYSMLRNRSPLARAIQERAKSQNKQDPPANE